MVTFLVGIGFVRPISRQELRCSRMTIYAVDYYRAPPSQAFDDIILTVNGNIAGSISRLVQTNDILGPTSCDILADINADIPVRLLVTSLPTALTTSMMTLRFDIMRRLYPRQCDILGSTSGDICADSNDDIPVGHNTTPLSTAVTTSRVRHLVTS